MRAVDGSVAVVEVAGIGYGVQLTDSHAGALRRDEPIELATVLSVRDDGLTLFGFEDDAHRALFEILTGVSGVGPKLAMSVLSTLTPAEISQAVAGEDDAAFRRVSGVGPKLAKLMVVSLSGRVAPVAPTESGTADAARVAEVVTALTGLGWPRDQAEDAVAAVSSAGKSVALTLREALTRLGGPRA